MSDFKSNQILLASDWKKLIEKYFSEIQAETSLNFSRVQSDVQMLYWMFAYNMINVYEKNALIGSPLFNYCYTKSGQQTPNQPQAPGPNVWLSFQPSVAVFFGPKQGSILGGKNMIAKVFNKRNYNNVSPQSYLFFGGYYYNVLGYCLADFVKSMSYILGIWYESKAQVSSVGKANKNGEYEDDENLNPLSQDTGEENLRKKNPKPIRLPQVPGTYPIPPIPRDVLYKKKNPKYLARPPGVFNFSLEVMNYLSNYDNLNQLGHNATVQSYCQNLTLVGRTDRLFYEIYGNQWTNKITRKTVKTDKKRLNEVKKKCKPIKYKSNVANTLLSEYNMVNFGKYSKKPVSAMGVYAMERKNIEGPEKTTCEAGEVSRSNQNLQTPNLQTPYDPNQNQGQNIISQAAVFKFSSSEYEAFSIRQTLQVLGQIIFGNANFSQGTYTQNIYRDDLLKRYQFNQLNIQSKLSHIHSVLKKMIDDKNDNEIYKYTGKRLKVQKVTPILPGTTLKNFQRSLNLSSQTQFLAKETIKSNGAINRLEKRVRRLELNNKKINFKDPGIGPAIGAAVGGFMGNFVKNPIKSVISLALSGGAAAVSVVALTLAGTATGLAGDASNKVDSLSVEMDKIKKLLDHQKTDLLADLENLITLVNTNEQTLENLYLKYKNLNELIESKNENVKTELASLNADLTNLKNQVNTNIEQIRLTQQQIGEIGVFIQQHWPNFSDQIQNLQQMIEEMITVKIDDRLGMINRRLQDMEDRINRITTYIDTRFEQMRQNDLEQNGKIQTCEQEIQNLKTQNTTYDTKFKEMTRELAMTRRHADELFNELEIKADDNRTYINDLTRQVEALTAKITELENNPGGRVREKFYKGQILWFSTYWLAKRFFDSKGIPTSKWKPINPTNFDYILNIPPINTKRHENPTPVLYEGEGLMIKKWNLPKETFNGSLVSGRIGGDIQCALPRWQFGIRCMDNERTWFKQMVPVRRDFSPRNVEGLQISNYEVNIRENTDSPAISGRVSSDVKYQLVSFPRTVVNCMRDLYLETTDLHVNLNDGPGIQQPIGFDVSHIKVFGATILEDIEVG